MVFSFIRFYQTLMFLFLIQFECCVSGAHKDLEGTIPITIGTVPLVAMGNFSYNTNIPLVPMAPSAPDVPIAPSAPELTKGDLGFSSTLYPSVRKY